MTLPNGVRFVFGLDGSAVEEVEQLAHEGNYVCSSGAVFKKLDYVRLAQEQLEQLKLKRDAYLSELIRAASCFANICFLLI